MEVSRPNPDQLLRRVQADEARARAGKLTIFFGYAAGVGKTYAMLRAAQQAKIERVDVVVGYVEPHGRAETEALLAGLVSLPTRTVPYKGVTLREFDLDAALGRKPQVILVDELAHTNAEGSRHDKRWLDVQELLEAGIDVWTTLNVQHVESLNDVIAQITGVVVHETLPDSILERANEIELIDLTPDDLVERLLAGKVYLAPQAERALRSFFQKGNLVALRELALRQTADRLRRDVDSARRERSATPPWATNERLLVCVGASPTSAKLIRTAKRMAAAFGAEWIAVAVETRGAGVARSNAHHQISDHLRLAERLGAETQTLAGGDIAETILDYARARNVTKIIVGKTAQPWYLRWLSGTVVDRLLDRSGDIDIYVIRGEAERGGELIAPASLSGGTIEWPSYLVALGVVAGFAAVGWLCQFAGLAEANVLMIFLLSVAVVAARLGRGPSIAAAVLNVLVFDFFFVPPYFSFAISDVQYVLTFGVMLAIGLLISALTVQIQRQLRASQLRERRAAALYRLTRQLSEVAGSEFLVRSAGQNVREIFGGDTVLFLRETNNAVALRFGESTGISQQPVNVIVAQWVTDHDRMAGLGTDTLPNATALFVPLVGSQRTLGALGVRPSADQRLLEPEQRRLLETCASLIALAIERDRSTLEAADAQLQVKVEQVRNSLLSSVSHDLRTPLAAIAGSASALLEGVADVKSPERRQLLQSIVNESQRLTRLVENLLEMTRLESGAVAPNCQWHFLEEIVGSALARLRSELNDRAIAVSLPADLPMLFVDGLLLEQVVVNLVENAIRYTPSDARIELSAEKVDERIKITLADDGSGLPPGSEERVFDKFFRGAKTSDGRRGVGLGLAICRSIMEVHQGTIRAANRASGGAEFVILLPYIEPPTQITTENETAMERASP